MTPVQEFFAAAIVLYLIECAFVLARTSIVFQSRSFSQPHAISIHGYPGTPTQAVVLAHPLLPLGRIHISEFLPFSLSATHIANCSVQATESTPVATLDPCAVPFDEIEKIGTDGRLVLINGKRMIECASAALAHQYAKLFRSLQALPADERESALDRALTDRFAVQAARQQQTSLLKAERWLRLWCNILWLFLFVVAPLIIWSRGIEITWIWLLTSLVPLWVLPLVLFQRAHKQLYPKEIAQRRHHLLLLSLTPVAAIRSIDALTRDAFVDYHPLAIAATVSPNADFAAFAQASFLDLRFPMKSQEALPETILEIQSEFRNRLRYQAEQLLVTKGIHINSLIQPPVPESDQCLSYCPRCRSQFVRDIEDCPTCPGVSVFRFDETRPATDTLSNPAPLSENSA